MRLNKLIWEDFLDAVEHVNSGVLSQKLRWQILEDTDRYYYDKTGLIGLDTGHLEAIAGRINAIDLQLRRLNNAIAATQTGQAGILPAENKQGLPDFNILGIEGQMTAQEVRNATVDFLERSGPENLGIAPLVVVAGVAVTALVVGAVITVAALVVEHDEIEADLAHKELEIENKILANPSLIEDWTEYKDVVQGQSRGLVDNIFGAGSGKSLLSGAAGVIAVVVIGYFAMKFMDKRKSK